ncbi:MAG: formylmethanofuran dehydrogenase subunit C [Candidatus Altiarchaeota archaeon]|nr:formylmethanofuran dehydrogenase subunit C [Candidatus Altiarchaeota archaeon]
MILLKLRKEPSMAVDAESLCVDSLVLKSQEQIINLPVYRGNKKERIGDYFDLEFQPGKEDLVKIHGNLSRFNRIGQGMTTGEMEIDGNVGNYLGALTKSGKIIVKGDVADYCGAMMTGGRIEIHGNARNYLGANYIGHKKGMRGGDITVNGNAGLDAGAYMAGGTITITGDGLDFLGFGMTDGVIKVRTPGYAAGGSMTGGRIECESADLLPTFSDKGNGTFAGDLAAGGKGEIYISACANKSGK